MYGNTKILQNVNVVRLGRQIYENKTLPSFSLIHISEDKINTKHNEA